MEEPSPPADAGFVVDWQLSDDTPAEIDLSTAESEVLLPADAMSPSSRGLSPLR
jgi:hypothetical protein